MIRSVRINKYNTNLFSRAKTLAYPRGLLRFVGIHICLASFFACTSTMNSARSQSPQKKTASNTTQAGIDSLESHRIGDSHQWLLLRGKNIQNPILLFLHGGPGSTLMPFARQFDEQLLDSFTVVHWDQRDSGKSFDKTLCPCTLTIRQYVSDCLEVIDLLRKRFGQQKIYLIGHSWGSIIGLLVAQKAPQKIAAYIGVGQVVDDPSAQLAGYQFAISQAQNRHLDSMLASLQALGPPPYSNSSKRMQLSQSLMQLGGIFHRISPEQLGQIVQASPDYNKSDRENQEQGMQVLLDHLRGEISRFNAKTQVPSLTVPSYFIVGRYDKACPGALIEDYFHSLNAAKGKWLFTFKDSGHFPFWEQPHKFAELLKKKVLGKDAPLHQP